jgi:hypothetical protein
LDEHEVPTRSQIRAAKKALKNGFGAKDNDPGFTDLFSLPIYPKQLDEKYPTPSMPF